MYSIGQKVVCINERFHPLMVARGDRLPVEGVVYTIRSIGPARHIITKRLGLAFRLMELVNPKINGGEAAFSAWRFTPLENDESSAETQRHSEALSGSGESLWPLGVVHGDQHFRSSPSEKMRSGQ